MPSQPGEVCVLTVFADVHYYFGPPEAKPPHHRFDKRSYVYLYLNEGAKSGRLEVANNAGTSNQDAFTGRLNAVQMLYSHKHPSLMTIIVGSQPDTNGQTPSTKLNSQQWHLPGQDMRNERTEMYKLHTLDIYLWTEADASLFLNSVQKVLADSQLQILDAPPISTTATPANQRNVVSPVVQQLENVAISEPYDRREKTSGAVAPAAPVANPAQYHASGVTRQGSVGYAPIAYNPAAPAAPEPVAHREKTPPPPDAFNGTGLAAATKFEQGSAYAGASPLPQHPYQSMPQAQAGYFPGPPHLSPAFLARAPSYAGLPPPSPHAPGSFPPPPPSAGSPPSQPYHPSFAPPPSQDPHAHQTSAPPHQSLQRAPTFGPPTYSPHAQQYASSPPQQQFATYPQSPGHPPLLSPVYPQSPGYPQAHSHIPPPPPSPGIPPAPSASQSHLQHHFPQSPPGGYSSYSYSQPVSSPPAQAKPDVYSMHSQVYRPTEAEAAHAPKGKAAGPPKKLEQKAASVEKGVNKWLKRLDKHI